MVYLVRKESPMTLEELSKLDYRSAMDLIYAYTTDVKRHEKDLESLRQEESVWETRTRLAHEKGLADLEAGASERLSQLKEKIFSIESSRSELSHDLARLKEALPGIKARERSIDPDMLQAELSMMTGEAMDPGKANLEKELNALETPSGSDALAELKRKMGLGG
jgi:phage shock protein A